MAATELKNLGTWELMAERVDAPTTGYVVELRFDSKEQADKWFSGEQNGNKPNRVRGKEI